MDGVDRAANLLQARLSWPQAEGCSRDLANAGLLVTNEQLAVIEAAKAWVDRIVDDPQLWADSEDIALIATVRGLEATS